jgi:phage shock protein C
MSTNLNRADREGRDALRRAVDGRVVGGVAAGVARYFSPNVTYVRIALVALSILGGAGVPLYLAAWALMPDEDTDVVIAETVLYCVAGHFS